MKSTSRVTRRIRSSLWRALLRMGLALLIYLATGGIVLAVTHNPIVATFSGALTTVPLFAYIATSAPALSTVSTVSTLSRATTRRGGLLALVRRWIPLTWIAGLSVIWLTGQLVLLWIAVQFPDLAAPYIAHSQTLKTTPQLVTLALTLLVAPISEELLMRGILYGEMRRTARLPVWVAVLVSAIVFAALHATVLQLPAMLLLGAFLALAYEYSGSIVTPIALHAIYNLLSTFVPAAAIAPLVTTPYVIGCAALSITGCVFLALRR